MAAVFILPGSVKMGVATFPPVDTAEEINELVEDVPDELFGLEEIDLVGAEVVGTRVEVTLSLGWLFDWCMEVLPGFDRIFWYSYGDQRIEEKHVRAAPYTTSRSICRYPSR